MKNGQRSRKCRDYPSLFFSLYQAPQLSPIHWAWLCLLCCSYLWMVPPTITTTTTNYYRYPSDALIALTQLHRPLLLPIILDKLLFCATFPNIEQLAQALRVFLSISRSVRDDEGSPSILDFFFYFTWRARSFSLSLSCYLTGPLERKKGRALTWLYVSGSRAAPATQKNGMERKKLPRQHSWL